MAFFRKKTPPKPEFDRERAMSMIPVRNRGVREESSDSGDTRLAYEATVRPWFAGPAEKLGLWDGKPMTKRVELDVMGRFVWSMVNGRNSVRDIATAFSKRYDVLQEEAELSVASFMRMLGERGIIGIRDS